jgi:fluoroquinolone transport system ATP-binding protein
MRSRGGSLITYTFEGGTGEVLSTETASDNHLARLIATNRLLSIHSKEPTLEDVFVELTGRRLA